MFQILDTAGSEQFIALREMNIKEYHVFVLIFALNSYSSFSDLSTFRNEIFKYKECPPIVLVGNKSDLTDQRAISKEEINKLTQEWECPYIEVSAFLNRNINNIFETVIEITMDTRIPILEARLKRKNIWNANEMREIRNHLKLAKVIKEIRILQGKKFNLQAKLKSLSPMPQLNIPSEKSGTFISDLSKLLFDTDTSDSTLLVGNDTIPIHTAILFLRCPQLYQSAISKQPLPSEFSVLGVSFLLEYLYTSQISKEPKYKSALNELQELAKFYNLKHLMKLCMHSSGEKYLLKAKNHLFSQIKELQTCSNVADITITLDDNEKFSLHKPILVSRSEWFKAAFRFQWKEKNQPTIHLPNISSPVFQILVDYLYTDELQSVSNLTHLAELLIASDQYQLVRLKKLCELELIKCIIPFNILNIFEYSLAGAATQLETACLHYLSLPEFYETCHKETKFKTLLSSSHRNLVLEIYSKIKNTMKERKQLEQDIKTCSLQIASLRSTTSL